MNKQEVFQHYSDILDKLLDSSMFFPYFFQHPLSINDIVGEYEATIPSNISLRFGATRGCIIDDDYNYVVKFDLADDCYDDTGITDREEKIYLDAVATHLEQYFPETAYVGCYERETVFYDYYDVERNIDWCDYEGEEFDRKIVECGALLNPHRITITIPLYAYSRADHYYCPPADAEERERAKSIESPLYARNVAIATAFIQSYGFEEYRRFSDFACEHRINDLHANNIGAINGNLIFIDYSGFHTGGTSYDESSLIF